MRCDDVIRELAAPTGAQDPAALAEHLAGCAACADWARRAAWLDQLWEATRPPEPPPEVWDSIWSNIAGALEASVPPASGAPAAALPSLNGSRAQVVAHPARDGPRPAPRSRTGRLARWIWVGLAQAAAILIALGLAWQAGTSNPQRPIPPVAQNPPPTPAPGLAVLQLDLPVKIEEGHRMVIRMEPQTHTVLLPIWAPGFSGVTIRAAAQVSVADLTPDGIPYGVDDWLMVLNRMESMDLPTIASR